ncbi:MAG: alanine/glycine:cation symporter family protein [Microscillaceae bacterium]|nr:alanine/glycine:cation symporter family protein [Microscillaceae bacterium]
MNKLVFIVLFCLITLYASTHGIAQSKERSAKDTTSIDYRINKFMEPATNAIESIVFFEVPPYTKVKKKKLDANDKPIITPEGDYDYERDAEGNIMYEKDSQGNIKVQGIPFVLPWLIFGAFIFTIYMGFINITGFRHALEVVRGKYDDPTHSGEVTHFQALTAALSGTVGVGNIAGVALAVSAGGPGATFWMILAGMLGMTSKFVECTLGLKYRNINPDGTVSGGPMYYLDKGLRKKGMGALGKVLAVLFAIACVGGSFGGGNMVQVNQAASQFNSLPFIQGTYLGENAWIFGTVMAILVALIIIGGIKGIARVTDKLVPLMIGIYLIAAVIVIFGSYQRIPEALRLIFVGAFSPEALYGGVIGVLIIGFRRASFSNEAGVGSASIAHAAAKTNEPISEGIVALLEPFIDTVIICTMTALVIVVTGTYEPGASEGVELTSRAFASVISWFPVVLSVAVMLFALSTMISWSYYGLKAWTYLFGENKIADYSYKFIFCFFVVMGSSMSLDKVFNFGDAMIFAMCFPNILGMYFLAPEIRQDLREYMRKVRSGEIKKFR